MKNYREKSCEGMLERPHKVKANRIGLSLLFFMLSVLGNLTYGASVYLLIMDWYNSLTRSDPASFG